MVDGADGRTEYIYYRTKESKFKPSCSQGSGLTCEKFEKEASGKELCRGVDFFVDGSDFKSFMESDDAGVVRSQQQSAKQPQPPNPTPPEVLKNMVCS